MDRDSVPSEKSATSEQEQLPFSPMLNEFLRINGGASNTMKEAIDIWSKQIQHTQDGLPSFFQRRLSEDARLMETLLNARDVNSLAIANIEFVKKSVYDYSDLFTDMCADAVCCAAEFWKPFLNGLKMAETAQKPSSKEASEGATVSHRRAA